MCNWPAEVDWHAALRGLRRISAGSCAHFLTVPNSAQLESPGRIGDLGAWDWIVCESEG